jgi:hypothetical protein
MGCEGEHRQAIDAEDIGPLIDALRYIRGDDVAGMEGHLPAKQVAEAALQPFEEGK